MQKNYTIEELVWLMKEFEHHDEAENSVFVVQKFIQFIHDRSKVEDATAMVVDKLYQLAYITGGGTIELNEMESNILHSIAIKHLDSFYKDKQDETR